MNSVVVWSLLGLWTQLTSGYPACQSIAVHEETRDNEGYGNQMHGMFLATTIANACNLTLRFPSEGRIGAICSRLGCRGAELGMNDDMMRTSDIQVRYLPKLNVRCTMYTAVPCEFKNPNCLGLLNGPDKGDTIRSNALRKVFFTHGYNAYTPIPLTCTDGRPPPDKFDVTVHFRAITDKFEHKSGTTKLVKFENATNEIKQMPPFADLVTPLTNYMTSKKLSKRIYLAANLPDVRTHLINRFQEQGYAVCGLLSLNETIIRHVVSQRIPVKLSPKIPSTACNSCIDATFSEWGYLTRASSFIAQMGMHCADSDCIDPSRRKYGWRSSFSYTAATYANVPVLFLTGVPISDESFTPSSACRAENTFIKNSKNDPIAPRFKPGPDQNRAKSWFEPPPSATSLQDPSIHNVVAYS